MPTHETCSDCRVLTLGSGQKHWRIVETKHTHHPFSGDGNTGFSGRCTNGVLYYQDICGSHRFIMRFDVRSETFSVITYPWDRSYKFWKMLMMISYEGKLAFVGSVRGGKSIIMWVLEDGTASKYKWSHHRYSPLSHYTGLDLLKQFKLIGIFVDGDLIYAPRAFYNFLYIIYIDPKKDG
ncbi:unnamed protein product [Eruca vesicaria subsp. sativa]|uniref:F-box associated beta-propeller type 3 domain-containing protein n=1 Tax=Eruca vesicaria subsp. sativa TaxID=29727 RepID=A0ABC8KAI5_ERUVS|nr:unnamed protein product [Eruca vesicaria subsp. sativa]